MFIEQILKMYIVNVLQIEINGSQLKKRKNIIFIDPDHVTNRKNVLNKSYVLLKYYEDLGK